MTQHPPPPRTEVDLRCVSQTLVLRAAYQAHHRWGTIAGAYNKWQAGLKPGAVAELASCSSMFELMAAYSAVQGQSLQACMRNGQELTMCSTCGIVHGCARRADWHTPNAQPHARNNALKDGDSRAFQVAAGESSVDESLCYARV